jgi:mannose-6-phosphate isomerase-like protein (cupin superfamily)
VPVYEKYNGRVYYIAISNADRHPRLKYLATVYHGIALNEFTLRRGKGDYLLFLGRIHYEKGVVEAIEVAKLSNLPLVIAGIIQDQDYFDREVAPSLDGKQIRYVGSVGPEARDELLGNAIALLHLINFAEPFGLSMIEAMACGVPVIARPRGSVAEIVRHGETGFIVETITEAVAALDRARRLDAASLRKYVAKNFSRERMVDDYLKVYQEVLRMEGKASQISPVFERRPWGTFTVLDESQDYKVKRIEVLPGKRLSYQKHSQRAEHWVVVKGTAKVTVDDREIIVSAGENIDIGIGSAHRVENPGAEPLIFIEVQRGTYLGEDDIVRLQDDFGRAG